MKHVALVFVIAASIGGCKNYIVRDGKTYEAELAWFKQAMVETANLSRQMVDRHCVCKDGSFEDQTCEDLADNIVTIQARAEYHIALARYNARLTEDRPPKEPPEIPPAESLCPGGSQ